MPGYAFLARQVLVSKRLLICGGNLSIVENLLYTMQLLSSSLQVLFYREAQPMYDFSLKEVNLIPNVCVVLCDYDVLSERQYIRLLANPNCIIIILTMVRWNVVPKLYRYSCTCVLEASHLFRNIDDWFCCKLQLQNSPNVEVVVRQGQKRFRQRLKSLVLLQRFVKSWLYRPGFRLALQLIRRCNMRTSETMRTKVES